MLVLTGKSKEGLEELQSAMNAYEEIGAVSSQANIYFFLGQVFASAGQKEEALKMVNEAVKLGEKIDPNHPVTLYMKEFLQKLTERQ
jgi:tetratricopeptide (TPR) repeat protein